MNKCYHHKRVLRRHKGQSHRFAGLVSSSVKGMRVVGDRAERKNHFVSSRDTEVAAKRNSSLRLVQECFRLRLEPLFFHRKGHDAERKLRDG